MFGLYNLLGGGAFIKYFYPGPISKVSGMIDLERGLSISIFFFF